MLNKNFSVYQFQVNLKFRKVYQSDKSQLKPTDHDDDQLLSELDSAVIILLGPVYKLAFISTRTQLW